VTGLVAALSGLLGLAAGAVLSRAAARFPWKAGRATETRPTGPAAPAPVVVAGTAALFVLTTLRFGPSWELPAFLFLAAAAVLLALIDLRHHLLPNRVVVPAMAIGAVLLLLAAVSDHDWADLLRGVLAAAVLFTVYLVLALINPRGLGMGDVKLAALLGLYLGWLGWPVVAYGTVAAFVGQALVALVLLATRRIGLRGDVPFGPAMLLGAALAIGCSDALVV
jgi:leader peptidase (prepilin peptidase) / N-methyltransferase